MSSNWDDWQDEDYIEEQRKALQEFERKQKEIKKQQRGKKKKKSKKKKGQRAGDALGMDDDQSEYSQFNKVEIEGASDGDEESKVANDKTHNNMSRTRLVVDEQSFIQSNFDDQSVGGETEMNLKALVGGNGGQLNYASNQHMTGQYGTCLLYTSPSPRDKRQSRMPSSA